MASPILKIVDLDLRSGELSEWGTVEIPIIEDGETIVDIKWIKNDRLYIKTSKNRWLLSKDKGQNWQIPKGRLPKVLLKRNEDLYPAR